MEETVSSSEVNDESSDSEDREVEKQTLNLAPGEEPTEGIFFGDPLLT